ncbi:MAG TPA: hypothetical protein VK892_12765 [Pyrinomonadaceae bacterium]|nr:hypothetical protein [Pyrinomonadaceae bacterium]
MTETLNINEISTEIIIKSVKSGDEIVLEENGKPIAKITPVSEVEQEQPIKRVLGLGRGEGYFMSDDFDDELPDEFWGFDKEL